jgi:PAS domain S-box-containing protein
MVIVSNAMPVLDYEVGRARAGALQTDVAITDFGIGGLFERLLDAVVVARLSTGRIVLWNPAAEKLFGYTAEEAVGKPIEILMPEPISHLHRAGLERYARTGHGLIVDADSPVEMPARTKQGDEIRVELALSELHSPSGERFALAVIRDATLRKQLELTALELTQARVARSEAEAALAARNEVLAAVKATLAATPGRDELQRLADALEEIKSLRLDEPRGRPVDVDLVDVVHAATDAARRRAANRRLAVHLPPSAPASCDPAQFRRVLDRVLDDLIHRSPEGGRIELRVEVLSPQLLQLVIRSELGAGQSRTPGVNLLVSRMLMQQLGGTLHIELSSGSSLEVVMTAPGTLRPSSIRRERQAASRRRSR